MQQFVIKRKSDGKYLDNKPVYEADRSWTNDISSASHFDVGRIDMQTQWIKANHGPVDLEVAPIEFIESSELQYLQKCLEEKCKLCEQLEDEIARHECLA